MNKTVILVVLSFITVVFFKWLFSTVFVGKIYATFSRFFQHQFITSDYIIMTGNFQNCNLEMLYRLTENIKKHPILWKLFIIIFGV